MQSQVNLKIKYRESFRPFAPSVLRERVADYFELDGDSPYMLLVSHVRAERRREPDEAEASRWGIALLKPIAINRGAGRSAVRQVIRQGGERLREGISVMIFPEGTRMPAGQTRRYGVSGAALAAATGAKIVPVAHNAGDYWPRRGWMKKPGTVTYVIGEPVDATDRDPREVNREIQDWIEKTIRNIEPGGD